MLRFDRESQFTGGKMLEWQRICEAKRLEKAAAFITAPRSRSLGGMPKKNMETQKLAKELDRQSSVSIAGMTVAAIDSIVKYVKWSKNIKEKIIYYLGTTMTKLTAAYKVLSKRATTTPQNDQEREREKSPV